MTGLPAESLLGYRVCSLRPGAAAAAVGGWIAGGGRRRFFACANPHSLEVAKKDALFRKALHGADLLVPDGVGMVIASRILGGSITERVTGSDVFQGVMGHLNRIGGSVFFLGSSDETLAAIVRKLAGDFPGLRLAGTLSPPFTPEFSAEDNARMIEAVNGTRPDVLWVGMTAPKQEKWIHANLQSLDVKFVGAIGAVFDFYAGRVRRSHPIFQRLGLEWLPRLCREPVRLWRRNFVSSPSFLLRVLAARARGEKVARETADSCGGSADLT